MHAKKIMQKLKIILIHLALFSSPDILFSQANLKIDSINQTVEKIKIGLQKYTRIEKINTAKGYKFVYKHEGEVKLISIKSREVILEKNVSWFYDGGLYIYCEVHWKNSDGTTALDEKFYFNNNSLISCIETPDKGVDSSGGKYKNINKKGLYAYGMDLRAKVSD